MRVIELGSEYAKAKERFGIMHSVATLGQAPGSLDGLRNLSKVQDALEGVSHEDKDYVDTGGITKKPITVRVLNEGTEKIVLEDAQYELLKGRFFNSGVEWHPAATKKVLDAYDVLCAAKEVKAEDMVAAQ